MLQTWGGTGQERGKERVASCREKCRGSETAVYGGKEADVGILKSVYCIYWLYHYHVRGKHKAHISWAEEDHWKFFSSAAW